jgi:predicted aconitase with swiveling domain
LILEGRTISKGRAEGRVLKLEGALSFLGGVDASTGEVKVENGGNVADRILVFPRGKGSTVGSFVMYDLKVHGKAPAAVINSSAETIVATGAVISSIPMVDSVDVGLIKDGDNVIVDADAGTVEIKGVEIKESASSVVLIDGKILMLKRPEKSHSYPGRWSLCAGKLEKGETPEQAAVREIAEETSIRNAVMKGSLPPVMVREDKVIWKVYPFIFDAGDAEPVLNEENDDFRLVDYDEMQSLYLVEKTYELVGELLKTV